MDLPKKRQPRQKDDRVILHFDYDCFYASVFENQTPALKSQPLGVKQKNILATCNYVARARGVKKLMLISEAKKLCPELVIVEGEDLTPFRDTSKTLFSLLRSYSWNQRVERLGLDEVFMDVTDMISYNMSCLNVSSLSASFFHLSKRDPETGFNCDLSSLAGCVCGPAPETARRIENLENPAYVRLLLASHLAHYLRRKLEDELGFTSTCGVSTNKLRSKLVGSMHKPRDQTTLLDLDGQVAIDFVDSHTIRKIPGIGSKITQVLEEKLLSSCTKIDSYETESVLTARDVRLHPDVYPETLDKWLGGPGSEQGIGVRIWNLLHGVDNAEVKIASDVPSQISIEDTYKGLETLHQIQNELKKLSASLIRRMRIDLVAEDGHANGGTQGPRWLAHPKTLRLTIRSWTRDQAGAKVSNYNGRTSRSQPLPNFVFSFKDSIESLSGRLAYETLSPMLNKFHPEGDYRWDLQLINICVANMVSGGGDDGSSAGRDISVMFKRQDDVLRQWRIDTAIIGDGSGLHREPESPEKMEIELSDVAGEGTAWEACQDTERCRRCGHFIPLFAVSAHARYHELGD